MSWISNWKMLYAERLRRWLRRAGAVGLALAVLLAATPGQTSPYTDTTTAARHKIHEGLQHRRARLLLFADHYGISMRMSAMIHDEAHRAGIEPTLGFALVRVESNFNPRAVSHAQAYGLAQVRLPTARIFDADITASELLSKPRTNLRLGFSYFRRLIDEYGDLRLAMLAYNRGPTTVNRHLASNQDPSNGYARRVTSRLR